MSNATQGKAINTSISVTLCSTFLAGGAGIAALRLHRAFLEQKINSVLFVARRHVIAKNVELAVPTSMRPNQNICCQVAALEDSQNKQKRLISAYPYRDEQRELFSFLTKCVSMDNLQIPPKNIVHLHWVSRMTDPALEIDFFSKHPVVWTLHDMQPFTGGCHHADECRKFLKSCGSCPHLGSQNIYDAAYKIWKRRKGIYHHLNMQIICPSDWLSNLAKKSSLLQNIPIHVIPNYIPLNMFRPLDRRNIRRELGITEEEFVIVFSAHYLVNRKGSNAFLTCLQKLAKEPLGKKTHIILLGHTPPPEFKRTGFKTDILGYITDENILAAVYNAADVLILPSSAENLPNVIAESLACGTPVVAFDVGGIPEMILHKKTGYLAKSGNVDDLSAGIAWAADARFSSAVRNLCRVQALEKWNPVHCIQKHIAIYQKSLENI